jgi:hypothetical protein
MNNNQDLFEDEELEFRDHNACSMCGGCIQCGVCDCEDEVSDE